MATKWKRVYVPGKGYRYTDGKGNYKTSDPSKPNYRTPVNDALDATGRGIRGGASAAGRSASRSASATRQAASRTADRQEQQERNGLGLRGRSKRDEVLKAEAAKPKPQPAAKPTPKPNVADYSDAQGNVYDGNSGALRTAAAQPLRSPAIGAPVHARPSAFGSAQGIATGSAYVQAPTTRPSTPGQAAMQQPNPYQAMGDIRGQQIPDVGMPQDPQASVGKQEYGGQKLQGIDNNGVDMERRRAFLDADNSLDGMKAVRDLLNRRKLSIAVEH